MASHLIIGASHTLFIAQALGGIDADLTAASRGAVEIRDTGLADVWKLLFLTPRTGLLQFDTGPDGPVLHVGDTLRRELAAFDQPDSQVLCLIGGNEHNLQFITPQPQPFDFYHPRGPALLPGRQPLPRRVIDEQLRASLAPTRLTLLGLRPRFSRARVHLVVPPPPCPSDDFLRRRAEVFDFARRGVENAGVRLKVYEVMVDILRGIADEAGYHFIAPPPSRRDADGFLAQPYWHDATHAATAYYEPILADLGVDTMKARRHASV